MVVALGLLTGCGGDKVVGTPDKAVLAYAELLTSGESDDMQAAGLTEEDRKALRREVEYSFIDFMRTIVPLSDESAAKITDAYFARLKGAMNFSVKLVKDDSTRPIVEITAKTINTKGTGQIISAQSDDILALIGMVGKLKSEGADDAALEKNPQVQKLAVDVMTKYIDNITFSDEKTLSVPCAQITNEQNAHWAPEDRLALIEFLNGQE